MKLLDRYIAKTVLASIALVTLMLAGLQLFMLFVSQLGDVGKADYGIVQASLFVLLQMPYQVYLFFPMASLLGCLIGLGILANHSELVVMRAAGMSIGQVTLAVLKAALLVIVVVTFLGEMVVPKLAYVANDQKMQALSGGQTLRTARGVWLRYQHDFIAVGTIFSSNQLKQVYQFRFDEHHRLRLARKIEEIDYINGEWQAHGIAETILLDGQTQARHIDAMTWDVSLKPTILLVSNSAPDEMSLHELRRYLHEQKRSHQMSYNHQLTYFQRLIQPLTTVVMMVLAIPFIFGPLRSSTMGSKFMAGAALGFCFQLINRFFGPISQLFQWPPEIAAFGPTCIFALLGLYLMHRAK